MAQKQRVEAVVREVKGMPFDQNIDKYVCSWEYVGDGGTVPCGREYRYPNAAEQHYAMHGIAAGTVTVKQKLEGFTYDGYVYHCDSCPKTYVQVKAAVKHKATAHATDVVLGTAKATGGDVLREVVEALKAGKFDLPELIRNLELAATIVDSLRDEITKTKVRELQEKAKNWDTVVEILSNDPWLRKVMSRAGK